MLQTALIMIKNDDQGRPPEMTMPILGATSERSSTNGNNPDITIYGRELHQGASATSSSTIASRGTPSTRSHDTGSRLAMPESRVSNPVLCVSNRTSCSQIRFESTYIKRTTISIARMIRQHNYHKASSTTATDTRRSGQDSSLWELPRSRSGPRAVVMEDGAQIPSLHYFPSPTSAFHELPFTDSASFSSSSLHEDEDVLEMRRMIPDLSFLDENVENDASSFPLRQSQAPHVVSTTYRESLGDVTNTI